MNIMVLDVAAEVDGSLAVLQDYYLDSRNDTENHYFFVLSKAELFSRANAEILHFPWVKRSWFHRLFFEYFIIPRLLKDHCIDKILSLQNSCAPANGVPQDVLLHNMALFTDQTFSVFVYPRLWAYKNILRHYIRHSLRRAHHVIVQQPWLKTYCIEQLHIDEDKLLVQRSTCAIAVDQTYQRPPSVLKFIYPASASPYKDHRTIVKACELLISQELPPYDMVFTSNGAETKAMKEIKALVDAKGLPIRFIGYRKREEILRSYHDHILVFPSTLEMAAYPLLEARQYGTPVITVDLPYAHESLQNYEHVQFFERGHAEELAARMRHLICAEGELYARD